MTRDEINREVAEKVMGYRQIQGGSKWWFPAKEPVTLDDAITDWNPAERIDHAWMVVEKFTEWDIRKRYINGKPQYGCIVYGKLGREFRGQADTAPMAICLAALKAKEGENGQAEADKV